MQIYLKIVFMNINKILEMRKISEQLIECTYKITHISAAIYPRFHTHLLSKFCSQIKVQKKVYYSVD